MTEDAKSEPSVAGVIQAILEEGRNVRDRVQNLVASTARDEEFSVASLGKAARNVMRGAYETVNRQVEKSVPRDQDGVLRDVVYGIGDAFGAAAKTVGGAFESATQHGREFASDDVKRVTVELRDLGATMVESVAAAGTSAVGHAADFAKTAAQHATKAAEEIKPQVEGALSAAAQHPVTLTKEAAAVGVDATRQVAGALFSVLGEMMDKAAAAMRGPEASTTAAPADGDAETGRDRVV
jgi:Family of unknown function (DUF6781)